jgi:NADH-quinone oxidoreductase subunit J
MTVLAQVPVLPAEATVGTGETVLFWVVAPIMVLAALGLLFGKKAVHAALALVAVMVGMAVLYAAQDAPFLFAAQIIVYTGAVMILFLFVLMLVGVDASDSLVETLRNHRVPAALAGLGLAFLLVAVVAGVTWGPFDVAVPVPGPVVGLEEANADGNPVGIARLVFSDFVLAFELTAALLITAALGAILMTHHVRLAERVTQRTMAGRRMEVLRFRTAEQDLHARFGREPTDAELARELGRPEDYVRQVRGWGNLPLAPLPGPGVFARHNAVDTPALLPDGSPSELSISRVLRARGQTRSAVGYVDDVRVIEEEIGPDARAGVTGSHFPTDRAGDAAERLSDAGLEPAAGADVRRAEEEQK